MFTWGAIVFIGLWLILRDVNPVPKARLMGSPMIVHIIVIGSGLLIHGGSADGAMAAIVAALERGVAPWVRPWSQIADAIPVNAHTRRPYRGVNFTLLSLEAQTRGFSVNRWLTYRHAQDSEVRCAKVSRGRRSSSGNCAGSALRPRRCPSRTTHP